jgi:hypothetical protein
MVGNGTLWISQNTFLGFLYTLTAILVRYMKYVLPVMRTEDNRLGLFP